MWLFINSKTWYFSELKSKKVLRKFQPQNPNILRKLSLVRFSDFLIKTRRTTFLTRSAKRNYNHSKHFLFYKENLFVSQKLDFAYYLYLNLLILLKILQNKSIFYEVKKCLKCPIIIKNQF